MEAKRNRRENATPPPASACAAAMAEVLGNDDLLREILLHLDFPTCLVRAAAVCRRWVRLASDSNFLRRFRELHPPRLLGFYLVTYCHRPFPRFVPLPQAPELAAVIRRASFELSHQEWISDSRSGHLIISVDGEFAVRCPLQPGRGKTALPKLLAPAATDASSIYSRDVFLTEDDGGSVSYTAVTLICSGLRLKVHICKLQGHAWGDGRILDLMELPQHRARWNKLGLISQGKLYMISAAGYIAGIDLPSIRLFYIKVPEVVVEHAYQANIRLSRAEGSGFYLIYAKGFQIRVWRYSAGSIGNDDWKLVDAICMLQEFGHITDPSWPPGVVVHVDAVGDNAKFVFLRVHTEVFYMCICTRTVEKVYDLTQDYRQTRYLFGLHPFMMVCAPTFPVLNYAHDQED